MALQDSVTLEGDLQAHKSRIHPDPPLYEQHAQQNRDNSREEPFMHSQGCPKYKVLVKMMRQSRSPTRNQTALHPKPWGARDPKQIPCTCGPIVNKGLKSAPGSVRSSPVRELRKAVMRRETVSPLRKPPSPERETTSGKTEVLKMFEEFCTRSDELGVKLSSATLDSMCHKIKTNFGTRSPPVSPIRSVANKHSRGDDKKLTDVEKRTPSQQSTITREASSTLKSPSPLRNKIEPSNNVMVEIAGPNFPEPGAAFPNIFGPVMPHERPFAHYVALGGGNHQFFGSDMIVPPIPTILTLSDSNENYIPMREVLSPMSSPPRGRRLPSPTQFPRRHP